MDLNEADPKGLVRESYLINGITAGDCRSIFLDWALSLPVGADVVPPLNYLIATYVADNPGHPMNEVLAQGLTVPEPPRRRGGRMGRL
ncbi:MAG: hypothetical protein ABIV25_10170 [Paracoccaceae bacterium]